jgi:dTDP-4-amino-4,6-dideoxygalactose transaminase
MPKIEIPVGNLRLTEADKKAVLRVLDSNRLSYGPVSKRFESAFAKLHDSKFAIFTNSGTSSLQIALAALKERYQWNEGDEVIVPAVTFVATSNIVIQNNMKPVFVDVEEDTFNIDPNKIESVITDRTRAIIPVHLLGLPASMDPIMQIADRHGLRVIEDSAETMFARYKGKTVGSFGDVGCFSTYIAHYIVTGVGGLNTTSDPNLAVSLRSLMNHGRDSIYISIDDDSTNDLERFKEIINRRFRFVSLGYSYRATEMEAALGLSQLKRKDAIVRRRKEVAARYIKGLQDLREYILFQKTPLDRENVYMLFGMLTKNGEKRDIINHLETNGIETRDLMPLINQPYYVSRYGISENDYPTAKLINAGGFYIGCHQYLSNKDIDYVVESIHRFYKK